MLKLHFPLDTYWYFVVLLYQTKRNKSNIMKTTTKRPANELKGVSYNDVITKAEYCYDLETIAIFYLGTDKLDYQALALVGYTLVNNHFEGCTELALEVIVDQKKFNKDNPLKFRQVIKDTERFIY